MEKEYIRFEPWIIEELNHIGNDILEAVKWLLTRRPDRPHEVLIWLNPCDPPVDFVVRLEIWFDPPQDLSMYLKNVDFNETIGFVDHVDLDSILKVR